MKNRIRIRSIYLLVLLLLTACSCASHPTDSTGLSSSDAGNTATYQNALPLPQDTMEFSFLSGAGAWRTILTLNRDGSFTGWHLDSEMGSVGEGYPHGSAYVCTFSGKFAHIRRSGDYAYTMTLTEIATERPAGEEWIEEGIRYIASVPYGLDQGSEFVFYLPATPVDRLSADFLTWWPYQHETKENPKNTLSCYGIHNVSTGQGFFSLSEETVTQPTTERPDYLSEIMKKSEEYSQLTKDEFIVCTNKYLSTGEWILPVEKSCFNTYGVNFNAYSIDGEYLFSLYIKNNADASVEYDFCLSHYSNGIVKGSENNASIFKDFIE